MVFDCGHGGIGLPKKMLPGGFTIGFKVDLVDPSTGKIPFAMN